MARIHPGGEDEAGHVEQVERHPGQRAEGRIGRIDLQGGVAHPLDRLVHAFQGAGFETMRPGDRDQVRHLGHAGRHLFDLAAERGVAGRERGAEGVHHRGGEGHREQEEDQEPRRAHRRDHEGKAQVGERRQPGIEHQARELLDRFHVAQHLALEDPGALARVVPDRKMLQPAAQGRAEPRFEGAHGAADRPHVPEMHRHVLQQQADQHARVDPQFRQGVPVGLRDDVDDVRREQRHHPHRAVLDDEEEGARQQPAPFATVQEEQRAQRILSAEAVFERIGLLETRRHGRQLPGESI